MKTMQGRQNFAMVDGMLAHAMRSVCHLSTSMVQNITTTTVRGKNHAESMMRCALSQ